MSTMYGAQGINYTANLGWSQWEGEWEGRPPDHTYVITDPSELLPGRTPALAPGAVLRHNIQLCMAHGAVMKHGEFRNGRNGKGSGNGGRQTIRT